MLKVVMELAEHCSELQGFVSSGSLEDWDRRSGARNSETEQLFSIVRQSQVKLMIGGL